MVNGASGGSEEKGSKKGRNESKSALNVILLKHSYLKLCFVKIKFKRNYQSTNEQATSFPARMEGSRPANNKSHISISQSRLALAGF